MDEKKKGKKKETSNSNEGHKKPWQEVYATPEEIKAMLASRVSLRYNEVRGRTEIHYYSRGPEIRVDDQGLLTIFGGDGGVTDGYQNLTDRDVNTLWTELSSEKPVVKEHLRSVIESDYVHRYHPFRFYLEQLRQYFYTKANSGLLSKDDLLTLAQYGLVCWEELDSMQPKELNKLKAAMTMPSINERAAYARYHENRPHLASFCGTGNNVQFLSDTTGTRRWLPFEVESIESPLTKPFDYDAIYAQAYALYREGFRYWFDRSEIEQLQHHNEQFETPRLEHELIELYFRKPSGKEPGEFMPVSLALQIVGAGITQKLNTVTLGRAFRELGFQDRVQRHTRGYVVVRRSVDEMRSIRQLPPQQTGTDTDGTEIF